jgi:transcription elongation factor GreB
MSRAFVKEDAGEAPLVPKRAPLPEGVPNYVTRRGLALLRRELDELTRSLGSAESSADPDPDRARASSSLRSRIAELETRLGSAVLVEPDPTKHDDVRFGASVQVRTEAGAERTYQLVGADEADANAGRIAFFAPVARALLGKRAGDTALCRTPRGNEELEVLGVSYDD